MALVTDPDDLNQGSSTVPGDLAFTSSSGIATTITGATTLPALGDNEYFEIRSAAIPGNNGLYRVADASPTTSSIDVEKITTPLPVDDTAEALTEILGTTGVGSEKSVMIDTVDKRIYLIEQGNLSTDGVTEQAVYSFMKKRWKDDDLLVRFDFPMVAVTPEQFEFVEDWNPQDNTGDVIQTRKLIRTGGWSEIDASSNLIRQYAGVISLGNFEDDTNDVAYYRQGTDTTDTAAGVDFDFAGPVNEAVKVFEEIGAVDTFGYATSSTVTRATGSFITDGFKVGGQITTRNSTTGGNDGTYVITAVVALTITVSGTPFATEAPDAAALIAVDDRNVLDVFTRTRDGDPEGKTYGTSTLTAIGVSAVDNKVFRYPLSSATDLNIEETDANIDTLTPYTEINLKYMDGVYSKDIDSATNRSFGVVVDVGTHSGIDGATAAGTTLTSADGGIISSIWDGGTLTLHTGTDENSVFNVTATTETTITTTETHGGTDSNISFTLQRATPVVATLGEIYEKVQRELRVAGDINYLSANSSVVVGKTADGVLEFVGSTLKTLQLFNPASGTSDGVAIEGFDTNDTNDLVQRDNGNVERTFPFVAAGTITFNTNLQNDTAPEFWMFYAYTISTAVSDLVIGSVVGANATWTSSATELPTSLAQFEFVELIGAGEANNNTIWEVVDASPTNASVDMRKYNGLTAHADASFAGTVRENPVDSPSALIVQDNSTADIVGPASAPSVSFDFDYDNNVQGGRTQATPANIVLKAIGLETAQDALTAGTITRATGLAFSLVAGLERNYTP